LIPEAFREYCEGIWLKDPTTFGLQEEFARRFQSEYILEPYLRFGKGTKPLFILTTNPGEGRYQEQLRANVVVGKSHLNISTSYYDASTILADFYDYNLTGAAATRIRKMKLLSEKSGADCVVQFESLPFHSESLPRKAIIPDLVGRTPALEDYVSKLTDALDTASVVTLSAVSTSRSIDMETVKRSPWLTWQASLLGVKTNSLELQKLVTKGKNQKVTCAFLHQEVNRHTRGFLLTMGSNNFPADEHLERVGGLIALRR
jgi:hypothetical protein